MAHAAAPAPPDVAAAPPALPPELLARVLSFLPPGDAILTATRLSKALAASAAPLLAGLRAELAAAHVAADKDRQQDDGYLAAGVGLFSIPLWALQEAWPWLREWRRVRGAARAACHGNLAALRWAVPRLASIRGGGTHVCQAAAASGQLEGLECASALGCPLDFISCLTAARNGRLASLQWLRAQEPPCPWDEGVCEAAAGAGHLAVLQWLRAQEPPCPWNEKVCSAAGDGGHLAVLQWLRAQEPPCPWDADTCAAAASRGDMAMLQWARGQEPPCPWDECTCFCVAYHGHLAVLQWARAQEPPCPWLTRQCLPAAGDAATAEWVRAQAALEGGLR